MKEITLTKGQMAIVDDEDYEWLNQWKWHASWHATTCSFRAARRDGERKMILMHRQILGCLPGEQGDHIHHNTLDNRRSELRKCTNAQNHYNMKVRSGGTSIYKGVSWHKGTGKWTARIKFNGHSQHLGLFIDEHTAALAYDAKAREVFGSFAFTNF